VLDQARNRVYLTNAGYNRVEVFEHGESGVPAADRGGQTAASDGFGHRCNTLMWASTGAN